MFKRVQPFLIILLMFQLVLGATAWMYSAQLCKMEDGCDESTEMSCCMDEELVEVDDSNCSSEILFPTTTTESCCFEVNTYFNFPLYRILKTELPSDHSTISFLGNLSIYVIGFNHLLKAEHSQLIFAAAESPPDEKGILFSVFRI
jgi:hypothetical protein